jgi:hypothetical protein
VGRHVMRATNVWLAISSRRRGICIWLDFAVVLFLTVFPPWIQTTRVGYGEPRRTFHYKLWHAPVFHQPQPPDMGWRSWSSVDVDYPRMATEIFMGECFVLALYLTWGRKQDK